MALSQRFNVNTQSVNGTDAGTHLSMKDIVPIQPVTKGTLADDEKVTVQQLQSIPYGVGNLSGTTYFVILLNYPMDFQLLVGSKILVKFNNAKSGTTGLNLSINGVLVPMYNQGVQISTIDANQIIEFTFIGTIANGVHTITGANASAGVSVSQLNGALTNYTKLETITDANNGIPPLYQSKEYFMQSGTNRPASARCFIVSKRDTYGSGEATQIIIQSAFISDPNNSPYLAQYFRRALSTDSGSTWSWSNWQKLATESDLVKYDTFTPTLKINGATFTYQKFVKKLDFVFLSCNIKLPSFTASVNTTVLELPTDIVPNTTIQADGFLQSATVFTPVKVSIRTDKQVMISYSGGSIPTDTSLTFSIMYPLF